MQAEGTAQAKGEGRELALGCLREEKGFGMGGVGRWGGSRGPGLGGSGLFESGLSS